MQHIHVASKSYRPGQEARYVVLVDGRYYKVNATTLDYLRAGRTPAWCGLEPYTNEEEREERDPDQERQEREEDRADQEYEARRDEELEWERDREQDR